MKTIGIIGWGAIGAGVGERVLAGDLADARLVAVHRKSGAAVEDGPPVHADLEAFLAEGPEIVLEAAGAEALREVAEPVLAAGRILVAMSAAGLVEDAFRDRLAGVGRAHGGRLLVPAGALGGVDAAGAGAMDGIDRVEITQRKPPAALLPPDEAAAVTDARVLDEMTPREAGLRFPKNANISVGLGLATDSLDTARVRVVADPAMTRNGVDCLVEGAFGRMDLRLENAPTANKRTSRLAVLSALGALRRLTAPIAYGF